ncbi:unnamed protein product [Merluccius merluccius]
MKNDHYWTQLTKLTKGGQCLLFLRRREVYFREQRNMLRKRQRQHIRWASPLSDHSHLLPETSGKRLISCPGLWEKVVLLGTAGVSELSAGGARAVLEEAVRRSRASDACTTTTTTKTSTRTSTTPYHRHQNQQHH